MSCKLIPSLRFLKHAKLLKKHYPSLKSDLKKFGESLMENPEQGSKLGRHLRKVRMAIASKGKGKSGGARVITYMIEERDEDILIRLLDIYDKDERETMTDKELVALLKECGLE